MWGEYSLFLAKTVTVVLAIGVGALMVAASRGRGGHARGHLEITDLGKRLRQMSDALDAALKPTPQGWFQRLRARRAAAPPAAKPEGHRRLFVVDFRGDVQASAVASLREEVSAILGAAREGDEVLVRLESPGGGVAQYGLAAAQLVRLREHGLALTVSVDTVAASGGYLMAAVAQQIIAAPFAIIGSIGVVAQLPNLNRWLKEHQIDYEQLTAGEYKRTLTLFGENTDEGRAKLQSELDTVHQQFKGFLRRYRRKLDVDTVATGETWLGMDALDKGLVDKLGTSDDYLLAAAAEGRVLSVSFRRKRSWQERLFHNQDSTAAWLR